MSERDTSNRTSDSEGVMRLDMDACRELDCLVCHCIEYLKEQNNIKMIKYPEPRFVEYISPCVKEKIENGKLETKGPVWYETTRSKIEQENNTTLQNFFGNLYALHVRCNGSGNNWKFKYIGVCDAGSLKKRLHDHLIKPSKDTYSQLWKVAYNVYKGYEIGASSIMIGSSTSHCKALARYVEDRVIEWLKCDEQIHSWGKPWNQRKG